MARYESHHPDPYEYIVGRELSGNNPQDFCSSAEFVNSLEEYVSRFQLPVEEKSEVLSVEMQDGLFRVKVMQGTEIQVCMARQVIIASGARSGAKIPPFSKQIAGEILQLHAGEYRQPEQLPKGNVLVIGSAESGCQIAEDLADAGKKVFLSTSMVARLPRRYRGRDILDWLLEMKFFDVRPEEINDPKELKMVPPQLTGVDNGRRTISLQSLAGKGVTIIGRMDKAEGNQLFFHLNAAEHVKFADQFSIMVKAMIDNFIMENELTFPPGETDEADIPDETAICASNISSLNLTENNIKTIIWATGFRSDLNYLKLPVLDADGQPQFTEGISTIPGLFFLGFPWLRNRKSELICGIKEDARFIVEKVWQHSTDNNFKRVPDIPVFGEENI